MFNAFKIWPEYPLEYWDDITIAYAAVINFVVDSGDEKLL